MKAANAIAKIDREVAELRAEYRGRRGRRYVGYLSRVLWSIAGMVRKGVWEPGRGLAAVRELIDIAKEAYP